MSKIEMVCTPVRAGIAKRDYYYYRRVYMWRCVARALWTPRKKRPLRQRTYSWRIFVFYLFFFLLIVRSTVLARPRIHQSYCAAVEYRFVVSFITISYKIFWPDWCWKKYIKMRHYPRTRITGFTYYRYTERESET